MKIFLDTNILYYTNDILAPFGEQAVKRINELGSQGNELVVNQQVLREYAHVTLRNALYHQLELNESIKSVIANISEFMKDFLVLDENRANLENWVLLLPSLTTYKDVYDFNIVSTLQAHGINHILTHNVSDFSKFSLWLTILPLFPNF